MSRHLLIHLILLHFCVIKILRITLLYMNVIYHFRPVQYIKNISLAIKIF